MSWGTAKLGEIAPAKAKKNPIVMDESNVWQLNLDMVEAQTGRIIEKQKADLSTAGSSTHWFDSEHVLYSKLRPYLNKVVLPDEQGLATTELVPMLPNKERLDRSYLVYYLRSKNFVDCISAQTAGAKMPRVSMKVFWDHEIPLPCPGDPERSLKEQKRIAAILDKADAIRRKRQQAIQLADEFLRSVFLDMFGDPVTNPKGWKVVDIEKTCTDIVDCINKTAKSVDYETPYKMIRTTNIRNFEMDITNVRYVEKKVYDKWVSRLVPEVGDIIFTREAPAGEAAIVNTKEKIFLGQRTMQFRPRQSTMISDFLLFEIMGEGIKRQMERMSSGSTVKHLSVPECKKFKVRMPPIELQKKFRDIRAKVISILEAENQASRMQIFGALSQKAFKGEL